ncbi:MAG: FAD-dependent oxidoreductase [Chloroflexota bacterium]
MLSYKNVILGGGLTAGYAAQTFAEMGIPAGDLCIVSAEGTLPYERPPLSKGFLAGEKSRADILINEPNFYRENGIEVLLDTAVSHVDFKKKRLYADDKAIVYEKLLIATGSRPHTFDLPGAELNNIFYLRQIGDARQIRQQAQQADTAVVIGGSFIGMEAASVLQSEGVEVTLIFPEKRVWEAFFTPEMSHFFENYYRERGVTILPEQEIASFRGDGKVRYVVTQSGKNLPADMVVAGIGVQPNGDLFADTGLELANGAIIVNRFLQTNIPDVLAAGDVTRYRSVLYERPLHIEHWDNAVAQGQHAARVMLGELQPFEHVPYFFSDVFDLSYEFWGDVQGADEVVHRGSVADGEFSAWWLGEDDRLLAAFVMNRPEEERASAPHWIQAGTALTADWLRQTKSFDAEMEATWRSKVNLTTQETA